MSKNWWPAPLVHIPKEEPWGDEKVVVAEVRHFNGPPRGGDRLTFSILVPIKELPEVEKALAKLSHIVEASGPRPWPSSSGSYTPKFWVSGQELPSKSYEPLVLYWRSHDKSVLVPDPGFLMTYGLASRTAGNGVVAWDDPAKPAYDVVTVDPPSVWEFPNGTDTTVRIDREHLQDYLSLRGMALVQVFWELRRGKMDDDIKKRLGEDEGVNIDFADRRFQLSRDLESSEHVYAQVWGARVLARPDEFPISESSLETKGLDWPDFDKPITEAVAENLRPTDVAYVGDSVLSEYEGKPGFSISPKSGAVSFGNQWSVGYCDRIKRDLIRIELKKLYEGAPASEVRRWNAHAVRAPTAAALEKLSNERNIGQRAEELIYAVVSLGESLEQLAAALNLDDLMEDSFVGLRRAALDYKGWWRFDEINTISRHAPLTMTEDAFLDRCLKLDHLVREGLRENHLRRLLRAMGAPEKDLEGLGTMKLLDRLVCMAQVAKATGLSLVKCGGEVWARLKTDGTKPEQPIARMFALYDLRMLKAHAAPDRSNRVAKELERFGVVKGEQAGGYGKILDKLYDDLTIEVKQAATMLRDATEA